ncbi:DUF2252 family protein [Peredibacter starrii]|uniref:DUF2252 family protein n=1 Tax=Peredibacter starrii TaxID=28202 RepID=A0AAX4HS56_9BACT|nr:DUF2252 family protein [Peredibacter starrii]WPU65993.1 DUF2252 family protein [Peredibacter starrii]
MKKSFFLFFLLSSQLHAKPCTNLVSKMLELYPDQNTQMMITRIKNAQDKHMFMRAFIPYYYKESFEIKETIPVFQKLKNHRGQIVGDAHVGNFGLLLDNKGKPAMTLVDYDDVGEAPLFLDVMRLSQSASYVDDFDMTKFLEAYKRGLKGTDHQVSQYMTDLQAKSIKGGQTPKAKVLTTPQGPRFGEKTEPATALQPAQQKSLEKVLQTKFGKNTKLHDSYSTMKESGGSAYGTRYHGLVEIDGKITFVEFKEIMKGGVIGWGKKAATDGKRVEGAMNTYLGKGFDENLSVVKIGDKSYQMRFKTEGNKAIDVSAVSKKEVENVIADEFYILGTLHRRSLGNTNTGVTAYAKDLETVSIQEWEDSVKVMKKVVKKAYNAGQE